jgi:alpha-1,2-mannosyltransferase
MTHQPLSRRSPQAGPDQAVRTRPWLARAVYGVLIIEIGLVIWYAVAYRQVDFRVYMWGGHNVSRGTLLYTGKAYGHWFTYPPFAAAVFAPISVLPVIPAQVLWELASVAAFAIACAITLKLAGWRATRTAVAAVLAAGLLLEPVYHTLLQGQINLILLALVLADVWRAARDRPAGIGVGIAAAIKLTPAIFVLLFLLARRSRAALTAVATFIACGLAGFLVAPGASRLYWTHVFYETNRIDAPYIGNQSPYGAAIRIFGGVGHVSHWYLLVSVVIGVAGLATAVVFARRGDWLTAAAVTGTTSLLVSPVSWTHHWVWILPALVVLARGGTGDRIAAACGYVLFAVSPLWWTPHSLGRPDYGFHGPLTLVANCYLIAGFAFLAVMAWRAGRFVTARPGPDRLISPDDVPKQQSRVRNISF